MESLLVIAVVVLVAVLIFFGSRKQKESAVEAARAAYLRSLSELKASPRNSDLRQQTLGLGRRYAQLSRDAKAVPVLDEAALMHDIEAASAAAAVTATSGPEERLRALNDLKAKGLIDDAEYAKRRNEILGSI